MAPSATLETNNNHSPTEIQTLPDINRVAVIGAGLSGVVSAAHLLVAGLDVTIFEKSSAVGGIWVYSPKPPKSPPYPNTVPPSASEFAVVDGLEVEDVLERFAPPTPAYSGLLSNVPTKVMRTSLLDWPPETGPFLPGGDVQVHIQDIAERYSVTERIRFNTRVEDVSNAENDARWTLRTTTLDILPDNEGYHVTTDEQHFDAVVVATGHYHVPRVPDVPGLSTFKERYPDQVTHGKEYREPSTYVNQTVLILGSGTTAMDLTKELSRVGCKVYQSSRGGKMDVPQASLPEGAERVGEVVEFILEEHPAIGTGGNDRLDGGTSTANKPINGRVILKDGRILTGLHRVIIAAGYITSYPFLQSSGLENPQIPVDEADDRVITTADGYVVHNLHKDLFYIPDPTLSFVGVPYYTSTFSLFDFQARVIAHVYSGKAGLPSTIEMARQHQQRKQRLRPGSKFHGIAMSDKHYMEGLLNWVNGNGAIRGPGWAKLDGLDQKWVTAFDELLAMTLSRFPEWIQVAEEARLGWLAD